MAETIEIEVENLTNNTIFNVLEECTKKNIDTKEVGTVLVWVGNILHKMEFGWRSGEIVCLQKKW
jgi:hypothetical protein